MTFPALKNPGRRGRTRGAKCAPRRHTSPSESIMTLRLFTIAALTAVLALSPSARADDKAEKKKNKKKGPDIEAVFKKLDANNDGKLSLAEFMRVGEELKKKKEGEPAKNAGNGSKHCRWTKLARWWKGGRK